MTLAITPASPSVDLGSNVTLQLQDGTQPAVTAQWSVSDATKATVDAASGVVTGVLPGTVTVTAVYLNNNYTATLTVNAPTSVTIFPIAPLGKGQGYQAVAMASFADGGTLLLSDNVTWATSDSGTVSVDPSSGQLTANEAGVATLTASFDGMSGTVNVAVLDQDAEEVTSKATRYRVDVPSPAVVLSLGEPATDFGYKGVSMNMDDGFFMNIGRTLEVQSSQAMTWITSAEWQQYVARDLALSTGANGTLASKRLLILSAGAGYGENPQPLTGEWPRLVQWNGSDLASILEPISGAEGVEKKGVRGVEKFIKEERQKLLANLGYEDVPKPPPPPLPESRFLTLIKLLKGDLGEPEGCSEWVDCFLPGGNEGGLLGVLGKASRAMDKADKFMARPETLPVFGPLFNKGKQLKNTLWEVNEAYEQITSQVYSGYSGSSFGKDLGTAKSGDEKWNERMMAVANLSGPDLAKSITPARNVVRSLRDATHATQEFVENFGQLLGLLPPPPSAAGIIAKDGISLLTQNRLVAFAPDGVHMISGAKADPTGLDLFIQNSEQKLRNKLGFGWLSSCLLGFKPPPEPPEPGFWFSTTGEFRAMASEGVYLESPERAVMRAETVEVLGNEAAGLFSRTEQVELVGKEVSIGMPISKKLKEAAPTLKAAQDAINAPVAALTAQRDALGAQLTLLERKVTMLNAVQGKNVRAQRQALRGLKLVSASQHGAKADMFTPMRKATIEQRDAVKAAKEALDKQILKARDAAAHAAMKALPDFSSKVFHKLSEGMPHKNLKKQSLPERVEIGSINVLEAFGLKSLELGSAGKITIERQGLEKIPSTVELDVNKAKVSVGGPASSFSLEVTSTGITIKNSAGTTALTLDASGIELKQGAASAKLTATGLTLSVGDSSVVLNPAAINIG